VSLFAKLCTLPYYQKELTHVSDISAPHPLKVVFTLSKPDQGFAGLVSDVKYGIQPANQAHVANNNAVIGSGPFKVVEHEKISLNCKRSMATIRVVCWST